jgi:hypothetical protein
VLDLARARWAHGRKGAASALAALAQVLAAAAPSGSLEAHVAEIRFQAERLSRTDTSSLGEAAWIKKALLAALEGLELLRKGRGPGSSNWSRMARQAVDSIQERSTINLRGPRCRTHFVRRSMPGLQSCRLKHASR